MVLETTWPAKAVTADAALPQRDCLAVRAISQGAGKALGRPALALLLLTLPRSTPLVPLAVC